jgi:arylsulfatase A-like enzyme
MRTYVLPLAAILVVALLARSGPSRQEAQEPAAPRPPNFIVILADDLGYGDLSCYGSQIQTPRLDHLAAEGLRLTDFYMASAVCSPARAALLTGCYPPRLGISRKLSPSGMEKGQAAGVAEGLHPAETTLAEALRASGYQTALIGKWHLGDRPEFLPTRQGFDRYFGLPYSNNMRAARTDAYPPLPLYDGETVIETEPDQDQLTRRYTEEAVRFVRDHAAQPFFLLLSHSMPHRPVHASAPFAPPASDPRWKDVDESRAETRDFLYPHAVREIDASCGTILDVLDELGLADDTLVLFTSDNGPQVGSSGPLRGGKSSTDEGGFRVPCVIRWPGHVPAGAVSRDPASALDLLPTFCDLAGAPQPEAKIDGRSLASWLRGEESSPPPQPFFCYFHARKGLEAIRAGRYKLHFSSPGDPRPFTPIALYDLSTDPGEEHDVARDHPQVVRLLVDQATRFDAEIEREHRELGAVPLHEDDEPR